MPKPPARLTLISVGFVLAALAVVGRAAQLELFQGRRWRARAGAQQTITVPLPARRGSLLDRSGRALAVSQETFGVGVAPRELDDPAAAVRQLSHALGLGHDSVAAALGSGRVWVTWTGPYQWSAVAPLRSVRGVYLERRLARFYPRPDVASRLVGRVDSRGRGETGLEKALDSLLAGRAGTAVMLRDARGRIYPSPARPAAEPVDGADAFLTIDAELQEIAERALAQAVEDARAGGGDVVILQPGTGEILALASLRRAGTTGVLGAVGDPYEPGSTAKVFTAAALLSTGKATPHDTVFAENGFWTLGRRTIHDTHPSGLLTLADVIRVSSNIGIAKLGSRLTAVELYEALRGFGFGSPTGVELPGESAGRLRHPRQWTEASAASLAMGYELAVTPLQLATAYAAFANGGVLVEPTLLSEVRSPDGTPRWRHRARPVRRVVSAALAEQLSHMLRGVVEEGTGRRAALGSYALAGKTGTARRAVRGRYAEGHYTASFVGLFPAVNPQLVLLVKIDDPAGAYFGGSTAAPATRAILEAALATPGVTLDRSRLTRRSAPGGPASGVATEVPVDTVSWPLSLASGVPARLRSVPDVVGTSPRAAARALHGSGFRVRLEGWGPVVSTMPARGESLQVGGIVVVRGALGRAF